MAQARGVYIRKTLVVSYRGFPDLVLMRDRLVLFWEVKREKGVLTKGQEREHRLIVQHGGRVLVTFGLTDALRQLDNFYPEEHPEDQWVWNAEQRRHEPK